MGEALGKYDGELTAMWKKVAYRALTRSSHRDLLGNEKMKSLYLISATVLAIATPAAAQDAVGSVGLTYGNSQAEFAGFEAEGDSYTLDASLARPAFGEWTVTFGGTLGRVDVEGGDDDTQFGGQAHLTQMFGDDMRAGGFVSINGFADGESAVSVGAEAQKYLANMTLTGVVAYTTAEGDVDAWSAGADAAVYVSPNLRLNAGASYSLIEAGNIDVDALSYGVGAEYAITSTPYSITAAYGRSDIEDIDVDTFTVGLRMSFGGGLQARDRAGANLASSPVMQALGVL